MINQWVNQRFEVVEKAGESALFTVYKAREKGTNRVVALKSVAPDYASDGAYTKALKAGMETTAGLAHPNIATFQEFGTSEDGQPYVVTEFVRGINLKERIRRIAPFTLSVAVDYACAIGDALQYAHSVAQVHGDLRPQNIIITPEGAVKVTDFGVQRAIAVSAKAQQAVLQTSGHYHAPELSLTLPGSVGGDIYALGAILYEMLTGTPVFTADTQDALADKHAFTPVPTPRAINLGVPRAVEGIVLKALQKRPEERYRTVSDMLADLKAVREALRFGKPLSWSPMDSASPPPSQPSASSPSAASKTVAAAASSKPLNQAAGAAPSSQAATMPTKNRLRVQDDRISLYIKIALGTVTAVIVICLIGIYAVYLNNWALPKPIAVQTLTGRTIDEVRQIAADKKFRLIVHGEYADKPRDIVYRTDLEPGELLRANRPVNVWYSQGQEYVNVPNLVGMSREEAERKLTSVGLKVGKIAPQYDKKTPINGVISQDVTFKKRVFHDTIIDLIVSNGPNPEESVAPDEASPPDAVAPPDATVTAPPVEPNPEDSLSHTYERSITLLRDGAGQRRVRVEYKDAQGDHAPVLDEMHQEGDVIPVKFDYFGKMITLRIYYDDKLVKSLTFDPQATRKKVL